MDAGGDGGTKLSHGEGGKERDDDEGNTFVLSSSTSFGWFLIHINFIVHLFTGIFLAKAENISVPSDVDALELFISLTITRSKLGCSLLSQ